MSEAIRFDGKVVVVTGAGAGLGRAYALGFAARGASVVVNDLGTSQVGEGSAGSVADKVVAEIQAQGGRAVANYDSVVDGAKIIDTAIKTFGRVDILINNAGILRDASFLKMTDKDWDLLRQVHFNGIFAVTKAAWPHFQKQKSGNVVNISSAAGLYGNYGQAHYSAFKLGTVAFTRTLALEGAKFNIRANVIAPVAGSRMTATVMPEDLVAALKPEYVVPLVMYLTSNQSTATGETLEVGGGWVAKVRWERTAGYSHNTADGELTPEAVAKAWPRVGDFTTGATYPVKADDSFQPIFANLDNMKPVAAAAASSSAASPSRLVAAPVAGSGASAWISDKQPKAGPAVDASKVLGYQFAPFNYSYTERDLMLYALGVGAAGSDQKDQDELRFVYELNGNFAALPTFGVIPPFQAVIDVVNVPGLTFNPMMLLHGETYLEIRKQPALSDTLSNKARVTSLYDKKSGAAVTVDVDTFDAKGDIVYFNSFTFFIRGLGGFGGPSGPAVPPAKIDIPKRAADASQTEKTTLNQALLYRLSGDYNPLHADPDMAAVGGFSTPILHGLATFGFAGRAVLRHFCDSDPARMKAIKIRFSKPVFPGETLRTDMWLSAPDTVVFTTKVVERNEEVLSQCFAKIVPKEAKAKL